MTNCNLSLDFVRESHAIPSFISPAVRYRHLYEAVIETGSEYHSLMLRPTTEQSDMIPYISLVRDHAREIHNYGGFQTKVIEDEGYDQYAQRVWLRAARVWALQTLIGSGAQTPAPPV